MIKIGSQFGKLKVISWDGYEPKLHPNKSSRRMYLQLLNRWVCLCDCGNYKSISESNLLYKDKTESCGCLIGYGNKKHGYTKKGEALKPTYSCWVQMRFRCRNKNHISYKNYGGRGITICERWNKFENFLEDMGERPSLNHSIDRINVNGHYEPGNCRWETNHLQHRNRRDNVFITYNGVTKCKTDWAIHFGISLVVLNNQLKKNNGIIA